MNNGNRQATGIKKIGLAETELNEVERSESERDGYPAKPSGEQSEPVVPDPQVAANPQRRRFPVEYKARIVREANACTELGQIGALLRREGLYSAQLSEWRRAYQRGALAALKDNKRGRRQSRHPLELENECLKKNNARLERRLSQAEAVIDIQKKLSEILGVPLTSIESEGDK